MTILTTAGRKRLGLALLRSDAGLSRHGWNGLNGRLRHQSSVLPLVEEEDDDFYKWEPRRDSGSMRQKKLKSAVPIDVDSTDVSVLDMSEQKHDISIPPSPSDLTSAGGTQMPITSDLNIFLPNRTDFPGTFPVFRLMDETGLFRNPLNDGYHDDGLMTNHSHQLSDEEPDDNLSSVRSSLKEQFPYFAGHISSIPLFRSAKHEYADIASTDTLIRAYRQMTRLREMDNIMLSAQRQGRIAFYATCRGEEAIHIGSASALDLGDVVFAQYREAGVLMWRGFTLQQFTNQCFSNNADLGKGRQMPIHYGSRALNYHTIASPLGTQIPQSVGAAYRLKLEKKPNVAICFFGEGAASTTDFHSACNFAATLKSPVIFFCRNNGYAISTPVEQQYNGDGIVGRAPGYGMAGLRVDGNDVFAVSAAVKAAKEYAVKHSAPIMVEAMTYRQGHHSTSDDSSRYRDMQEVEDQANHQDPMKRLDAFMAQQGILNEAERKEIGANEKRAVLEAMKASEELPPPPLSALFEDVYNEKPQSLIDQEARLREHMAKYPERY